MEIVKFHPNKNGYVKIKYYQVKTLDDEIQFINLKMKKVII